MLCSQPEFAVVIKDNDIISAARHEHTLPFIIENHELPTRILHIEQALGGFNCV
jgi:hypothetical protein